MKIIIFTHPGFSSSQSMPRFAQMIADGMTNKGFVVCIWSPRAFFWKIPCTLKLKKWLGYLDQFILFPLTVRLRMLFQPALTLYIVADQALGPWVPMLAGKPHVIHVHDFMALRSARGEFYQNPTSRSGKIYQEWIRRGFSKGNTFICVSNKTKSDLQRFMPSNLANIHVVHNGLNYPFIRLEREDAVGILRGQGLVVPSSGVLLHVGGNQWYKNRPGVLVIYAEYARTTTNPLPLWMIGQAPTEALKELAKKTDFSGSIHFLTGLSNDHVMAAYSVARLLIFPSITEGFGWPIAEAMACGCPVLTTGEAPMTEVGGSVASYIPVMPVDDAIRSWTYEAVNKLSAILNYSSEEQSKLVQNCIQHASKFKTELTLTEYERIYCKAIE